MARKKPDHVVNSPAELSARVDRAASESRYQIALELAKQLYRHEPTPENKKRLTECYLGRARQLLGQGSTRDAAIVLEAGLNHADKAVDVTVRFAEELARCGEAKRAMQLIEWLPEPRPANRVLALAADGAMQRGAAGRSLVPEALQPDFDRIRAAFTHLTTEQDDAVRGALQAIGLNSPFLEWKLLLRGLLAFYQNDNARAIENWSRLDSSRLPARLAAPFRMGIDKEFAAAQPPATQQVLRRQADRLVHDPVLSGLKKIHEAIHKGGGMLHAAFREVEGLMPLIKPKYPEFVGRLARCMYWEIIEQGQPEDRNRYLRLFDKPPDDPDLSRLTAIAMEHIPAYDEAHLQWQRYEKLLEKMTLLTEAERTRARAMVWFRMGVNANKHQDVVNAAEDLPPFSIERIDKPRPLSPSAEKCFQKAIELAPNWIDPHLALIDARHEGGKIDQAIAAAEALLAQFPEHLETLELLGRLHGERGNAKQAVAMLERALAVNPVNRTLRRELAATRRRSGISLMLKGRIDEARALYQATLELLQEEPHASIEAAWAACEFKAGNNARAEELLQQAGSTPDGRAILDGMMYSYAVAAKLPKAIKARFETSFKAQLEAPIPTPEQAAGLMTLFALLESDGVDYHGSKTHRKKALSVVERSLIQLYTEPQMERAGTALIKFGAVRLVRKAAFRWAKQFPHSPWPPFFEMESHLGGDEDRWPLWRLKPLAERAKDLADKMPAGPNRDLLLGQLQRRIDQFHDMNPYAAMFDRIMDEFDGGPVDSDWEDDNPW